jgi:hypothetical protein
MILGVAFKLEMKNEKLNGFGDFFDGGFEHFFKDKFR